MIAFNSSLPRSGSELLQVLLNQRTDTYAGTTSPLLEYCYGAWGNIATDEAKSLPEDIKLSSFSSFLLGGIHSYAQKMSNGKHNYIDKSRGWIHYIPFLKSIGIGNPKILCMIRDLRDVIASMEMLYRKNSFQKEANPLQNITVEERSEYWLTQIPVGLAVRRITNALTLGYDILYIKYETLCSTPYNTMKEVEDYLELPPFNYNFNNIKKEHQENNMEFGFEGVHDVLSDIRPVKSCAYNILGSNLCNVIQTNNILFQKIFGYY